MNNKIEVNEYVRTKDGIIDKVIIEYDGKCNKPNCSEKHISCKYNYYNEKEIVKHSKQLIDLIEVQDIVNGMEVLDIHKPRDLWEPIEIRVDSRYTNFILAEDIKTVLTKESYMANCYKVGGGEEECM